MAKVTVNDAHPEFVSEEDAEQLTDDGSGGLETEEEEAEDDPEKVEKPDKKAPAKKAATKKTATDPDAEKEEEEDDEEEEEDEDEDRERSEVAKLQRKLARTATARQRLEDQVRNLQQQARELEERQSDAGKQRLEKITQELDDLYQKVEDLRAEGKTGEAAKAQRRIDDIREGMSRAQTAAYATQQALAQTELRAYNALVKELGTIDPRFDPEGDEFDDSLNEEIGELVEAYEAKGMDMTTALRKAVKAVLREDPFGKAADQRRSLTREASKKAEPKKTDIKKNLATEKRQPPDEPGQSREKAQTLDIEGMSEAEFDALPESKKREIRGDNG
jgi:hypothetical protein